ncbi:MAG: FAD:protein FMN transferase [Bdellovibrionota bacterium]
MAETLKTRAQPLLGTFVEISLDGQSPDALFGEAFARLRSLERLFNYHDPESELSCLNRSAGEHSHPCSPEMFTLLRICGELFEATGGLFDPTVNASAPGRSFRDLIFQEDGRVRLSAGTALNLNGVAKGFLVDRVCEFLLEAGARSVVVNAGGDLRREGEGETPVWVRDPSSPGELKNFGSLRSGAVATSAGYFLADAAVLPYVDPRNGQHLTAMPSVTVAAPYCVHADALTKLALLAGESHSALEHFGARAFLQPLS